MRDARRSLRLVEGAAWPVDVLIRSPLVCRDADILGTMDARVGLSVPPSTTPHAD